MKRDAKRYEWSGGHAALDLVNTLDERPFASPIENLATYGDVVDFAELASLLEPSVARRLRQPQPGAGSRIAARVRGLREHLHEVLTAAHAGRPLPPTHLEAIDAAIRAAHAARALTAAPREPGLASRGWANPAAPDTPLFACALAIESLLVDVDCKRIKKCGASDCGVFYVDTSKGQRRQWCSMRNCGNREKQRRWRAAGV